MVHYRLVAERAEFGLSQLSDITSFIEQSKRLTSPLSLRQLVDDLTREMGFDHFALIHHVDLSPMQSDLRHMSEGSLVALTNYPEEWVNAYVQRNIVADDPVLIASTRSSAGFRWSDTPQLIDFTQAHREVTEDTRRAGLANGFTIPAHVPGEANGSCNFAVRFGRDLPEQNLHMAQWVGSLAFQSARMMVERARNRIRPPQRLTTRQLECLVLVAKGKSDWEIGKILGISELTVKTHINEVRRQYDVRTRIQATFRAVADGLITVRDALR